MCDLPDEVPDGEKVVRGVKTRYHVDEKRGRLKHNAFRPKAGLSVVSVVRLAMGSDFCKDKARQICGDDYRGLAVVAAGQVRKCGSAVLDHRADFCGHAHVDHGFPLLEENEPGAPEVGERMRERCKAIVDKCLYHADPRPGTPGWTGPAL